MVGLALLVASIGLADSINPSTVIPALWLAGVGAPRVLASFTIGVFAMYMVGGLVLVFGPGPVLVHALHHLQGTVEHSVEAALGVAAIIFALAVHRSRQERGSRPHTHRSPGVGSAFTLGAGIMVIELPTAFIYFGAIAAIVAAHPDAPGAIMLVVLYNVVFVAPLVALVVARRVAGERADRWIASAEARLQHLGQLVLTGVAGVGGAALLTIGLAGLVAT